MVARVVLVEVLVRHLEAQFRVVDRQQQTRVTRVVMELTSQTRLAVAVAVVLDKLVATGRLVLVGMAFPALLLAAL
jgi:hypothetical protein